MKDSERAAELADKYEKLLAEKKLRANGDGRQGTPKPRFNLVPFDDLKIASTSAYLVKGIIPRTGLVIVWGPPKCGKSFLLFTVMLHVALGWEYRGHRVQQGNVAYLALEGQDGFGARAEAFRSRHMSDDGTVPGFYLVKERTDLIRDHKQLIACIKAQCQGHPAAVVIDTMNRSLVGSESDDQDMAAYMRAADAIGEELGCVVIVIHHCGVDGTRPRGHTSQTGAVVAQIAVKKDAVDNVIATVEYAKDMAEGTVIASRLEVVELGIDQDGDPITSCVVVPVEDCAVRPVKVQRSKGSRATRAFRDALNEALDTCGQDIVIRAVPVRAASVRSVRSEFTRRYVTDGDDAQTVADAKRKAFKRALDGLGSEFATGEHDSQDWIWRV